MNRVISLLATALLVAACGGMDYPATPAPPVPPLKPEQPDVPPDEPDEPQTPSKDVPLASAFTEQFSKREPETVTFRLSGADDLRYFSGVPSLSARNTDILMLRTDPASRSEIASGTDVEFKEYTYYGSYSAKLRIPSVKKAQPKVGAVAAFSVSDVDEKFGLNEISFEWMLANPQVVILTAKTGVAPETNTVRQVLNLSAGTILEAYWESASADGKVNGSGTLDRKAPEAISGYDASARLYTYGFDWNKDSIIWWVVNPADGKKITLWNFSSDKDIFPGKYAPKGIPVLPSKIHLNFYHSAERKTPGVTSASDAPKYPFEMETDWVSYEPLNN